MRQPMSQRPELVLERAATSLLDNLRWDERFQVCLLLPHTNKSLRGFGLEPLFICIPFRGTMATFNTWVVALDGWPHPRSVRLYRQSDLCNRLDGLVLDLPRCAES
eukprot:3260918-Pleurochrysis_carterae.AAC.1